MATKPKVGQIKSSAPRFEVLEDDGSQFEGARFYDQGSSVVEKPTPPSASGALPTMGDMALKVAQGVVGLGQSAVGLGNLASGGLVGKGMNAIGYNPERTNAAIGEYLSDSQKASDKKVQEADGFVDTVAQAVANPRSIFGSVAQSAPGILLGGGVTTAVARRIGAAAAAPLGGVGTQAGADAAKAAVDAATKQLILAGSAAEGAQSAGQIAEQAQREGRSYGDYALPALGAGALTAGIGYGAGRLMGDATTAAFTGSTKAGLSGGMPVRIAKSMASDGTEETLQSGQEQAMTNLAMGKPIEEGVGNAAGMGLVTGAAMGGGMAAVAGGRQPGVVEPAVDPAKAAADAIRATEMLPASGPLANAVNAGVESKAQAVQAGAPLVNEQSAAEPAPDPVDDPVRDQILALPDGARQDALRAYVVVNRADVAKGVQQYNRKLLDRLLAENAPAPVLGERLTDTDVGSMLGGGGMMGRVEPLAGALGMNRATQANSIINVDNAAQARPPIPASDAVRMLDEARNRGLDLVVAEHPSGGFVIVPPAWITPEMAKQGQARLMETVGRMQQVDAQPVERATRTRTDGLDLNLPTDTVQNYVDNLRTVNTPAARAYVREFDAGRIAPDDVQQRMVAEQGQTPDQRIARAAAEAPAPTDPVADRLARAAAQGAVVPSSTDILNPVGQPFKTRMSAGRAAKNTPGDVVPVEGGFVVRPQEPVNAQDVPKAPEESQAAQAISQPSQAPQDVGAQPAGPAAGVPAEGVGAVETAGAAPAPTRIGRDQTLLSEGGKPFKTRKAAGDAKKQQPMMRVVTVPGGYALTEKTPAQLAAEAKAAKRLATPRTSARGEPIPAHAFVAAAGGLNPVAASDLGVDGNPRIGNRRLFSGQGRGLSMDQATQMLVADGYLSEGATVNDAFALIKRSLTQPQYNADGIERIAEAESTAQFEDYLAAQEEVAQDDEFDPFGPAPASLDGLTDDALESSGYDAATDAIKAEVRALLEMANAQGIDAESIMLDAHEQTINATEQDYYEAAKSALEAAITGSNQDRGTPAGSQGQGPGAAAASAAEQRLNRPEALDQQALAATENAAPAVSATVDMPPTRQQESSPFAPFATGRYRIAIRDEGNSPYAEVVAIQRGSGVEIEMRMPSEALEHPAFSQLNARAQALFETPTANMFDAEPATLELAAQTPAEAAASQEQAERAEQAQAAAKRAADAAVKAEDERKRIAQASVRAADRFELGQDPMDSLTGQGSVFDVQEPEQQAPKATENVAADAEPESTEAELGKNAASKLAKPITDVGEKIGGARKDTAVSAGTKRRTAKEDDERPTWAKRYKVSQVAGDFDRSVNGKDITGKWLISDTRSKDAYGQPKHMGRKYFDTSEEAEAALPLLAVAQKHRVTTAYERDANGDTRYEIWRDISDRKRVKVVDRQFATREEAMEYMAKNPQEILDANTTFGEADIPKPESTTRKGVERRTVDAEGDDFMQAFGLRGVEFGNWNNQAERQEVMNEAFDGLMDLAEALNLPPKALGLNGDLALAFGARGQGLSGARAHYEPARVVMNLTKMNGAGALAHEWFHALDHYLARQDGSASAEWKVNKDGTRSLDVKGGGGDFASSGFKYANSGVREELRAAYTSLVKSLFSKAEQYVEDTAKADKFVAVSRGELEQQLAKLRTDLSSQLPTYVKRNNKPASAEQLAEFDSIAAELVEGRGLAIEWKTFPGKTVRAIQTRHTNEALEKLGEIYKAVRGRAGFNAEKTGVLNSLSQYMRRYEQRLNMLRDASAETTKTKSVPTSFAMDAKSLDQGRGGDYWTTPHEMAARAFQGYVEDKIAEQGGKSPFLNYAPENAGIITPWGAKRPFPAGDERRAMNAEFDKFVGAIKTKETEGGNVAMFSRSSGSVPQSVAKWLPDTVIADEVEKRIGGFAQQPPIRIRDTAFGQLPGVARDDNVAGAVHDGAIYLFRDQLGDRAAVQRTLFHELFHYGLRKFLNKAQFTEQMMTLYRRDKAIKDEADRWAATADGQRAREFGGNEYALARGVDEALAVLAEPSGGAYLNQTARALLVRRLTGWLANVAEFLKMDKAAAYLRSIKNEEAREYIQSIFKRLQTDAGEGGVDWSETGDTAFSRTADTTKAVGDAIKSVAVTNLKQKAGFKATDYLGVGLQALGRRQIVDIYGDAIPLDQYNKLVQQMEADKNEGGAEADQLVTQWAKLPDEGKLADLMHDATLAQIDPSVGFVDGDDKGQYLSLQRKYNLLSSDAKKVYADTRDAYKAHHAKVRSAIKERIERSELKGPRKAELLSQMDGEFFKAVKGVYFPLARFGQYAVTVKGADGKVESVSRAETKAEAEALRSNLLSAFPTSKGFTVGRVMLSKDFIADRDAVGRGFMTELYQALDKQDMDAAQRAELEDTLGQLYLSSLPDLSWAKHGIHRKGTPGFSQDARRAFAQNMFHGSRYLAKLRYSDLMQDELTAMQKHVDDWREVPDYDQNSAQRVVDEMNKRHESLMNPKSSALSTALTSFGFVFHLGLSPASALVNLSQTALVAYPIMGAKWGFGKASAALLKASAEATKGKNDITGALNADERAAYDEAVRAGTIDVTMAHDLAGIAQGEDAGVMWKIRPVMRWASFLFHHAERFNRQVTFVAAYRLAREAGADSKVAFEQATKATYDGHFDYGAANRPRLMQGNVAKVVLLFKQYGQNMVYTLARNAQQAIKAETPEARAQARKALAGLLVTHASAAGVLGLPMVTTLLAAASMIGGDDDEPWDAQVALQNMLADTFGQKTAEVMSRGLSRLTPWDISGRVGLDKLIFPDIQEGLEGQRLGESAMAAALGPVAGIGINVLKGLQDISRGQYERGLESMMPAALRGPIKSMRYQTEGVQDKTGIVIKDEVSAAGVAGQFLGFSPSEVRQATEGKSAVYQQDRALGDRRQELMNKAARATMDKDAGARTEVMQEIAQFNQKHPARRITPLNVLQSVRNRQKRIDQADGGVYLPKNRRDAMEAGRFAAAE